MAAVPVACGSLLAALLIAIVACAGAGPTLAAGKHAFVVGIDRYDNLPKSAQLEKAVGDAWAMRGALHGLGFVVAPPLANPTRSEMLAAWYAFLDQIQPGDWVAVVFSGHGVELEGANYLMPRDVRKLMLGREGLLRSESIAVGQLTTDLRARRQASR
jgi:hypothetical protein